MQDEVLYEVRERVAIITLNRPDRLNAYTATLANCLKRAFARADADSAVRVIVLTGAGRGFCAGADMDVLSGAVERGSTGRDPAQEEPHFSKGPGPDLTGEFADAERFGYFVKLKKPVIAAINGPCAGIGMVMALYADLRLAADSVVFTTAFAQRGLVAEHGISWLLPRLIGQAQAMDLLLSARRVYAEEAKAMGLVNTVYPMASFLDDALGYARILAETVSPRSMAVMKAQVWKANFQDFNAALATADTEMAASLKHSEFKEGVAHFVEKRKPRFADL